MRHPYKLPLCSTAYELTIREIPFSRWMTLFSPTSSRTLGKVQPMTEALDIVIIIIASGLGIGLGWVLAKMKFSTELVRAEVEAQAAHGNKATLVAEMEMSLLQLHVKIQKTFFVLQRNDWVRFNLKQTRIMMHEKRVELLVSPIEIVSKNWKRQPMKWRRTEREHTRASSEWLRDCRNKRPIFVIQTSNSQLPFVAR